MKQIFNTTQKHNQQKPITFKDFAIFMQNGICSRKNTLPTYDNTHTDRLHPSFRQKQYRRQLDFTTTAEIDKQNRRKTIWNDIKLGNNQQKQSEGKQWKKKRVNYFPQKIQQRFDDESKLIFRAKSDTNILKLKNLAKLYQNQIGHKKVQNSFLFKNQDSSNLMIQQHKYETNNESQIVVNKKSQNKLLIKISKYLQKQNIFLKETQLENIISYIKIYLQEQKLKKQETQIPLKQTDSKNKKNRYTLEVKQQNQIDTFKKKYQKKKQNLQADTPLNFELTGLQIQKNQQIDNKNLKNGLNPSSIQLDEFSWMQSKPSQSGSSVLNLSISSHRQ